MFLQLILNGFVTGMLVALPAIALTMTYGILRFPNFAIGSMITLGAHLSLYCNVGFGLPLMLAVAMGGIGLIAIVLVTEKFVYHPLRQRDHVTLMVASIGVYFVYENFVRLIFGTAIASYDHVVERPHRWLGLRVNNEQIAIIMTAALAMLLVWIVLMHTSLGRAMRAVEDNPELADVRGINRVYVIRMAWAISAALTTIAGTLIGLDGVIEPTMGWNYLLPVFAAVILGGIGNPIGAAIGAILVGLVEELSTLVLQPNYRQAVSFIILAWLLLFRPYGLLGKARINR